MSGHSKWKNIAHKKEKTDSARAQLFTKLSREIIVVVRAGGPDPASNPRLKDVIAKARAGNVPNDNIKRVIERAAGGSEGDNYDSVRYEGYGPCGVAVIVDALTNNRNRTAGEVRHYFDKFGGNMGAPGSVSWSFDEKGLLVADASLFNEDDLLSAALECGAEDFSSDGEVYEITTAPGDFSSVCEALEQRGYTFLEASVQWLPQTYVALTEEDDIKKMNRLIDSLEENDDVQNVWHNSTDNG